MEIKAEFEMNKPDNRVEYDIWYTSSNDRALDFIRDFAKVDAQLGTYVLMEPHFVFWECPGCDVELKQRDCFADGKYCAYESSNDKIKGRDIILEDLREKCLYKKLYAKDSTRKLWWEYMKKIHMNCKN